LPAPAKNSRNNPDNQTTAGARFVPARRASPEAERNDPSDLPGIAGGCARNRPRAGSLAANFPAAHRLRAPPMPLEWADFEMNWSLFQNSLFVSGLTTLLATGVGFLVALTVAGMGERGGRWLLGATVVALALPPFLATNCWLDLLGNNGAWRSWLAVSLYSPGGAVWLLTLLTWPITTLFVLGAWGRLESPQLESDPALSGWALIRWLLWPLARAAVGQAAVLTFVLALNNFAVPVILQVRVFPEELWLAFTARLDEAGAWAASAPLVIVPVLVLLGLRKSEMSWPRPLGPATAKPFRRHLGRSWLRGSSVLTAVILALSVCLPFQRLVFNSRTWTELPNLWRAAPEVIWNSFEFAAASAAMGVVIGLVTWRRPFGLMVWLPFLVPGVLMGRMMIFVWNGTALYGTAGLAMAALAVRYLGPGWNGVALARRGVDRDLVDAASLDSSSGWILLRHVVWPQIAPQVGAVWYVTYLLCLWDVETLVLIYPPGGETLALRVFNLLHYGHNAQVNALCVTLLALAVAPLMGWGLWRWLARARALTNAQ